ncbi:MAG: glycosyltransferase, partial [Nitrospirota bacterium]
GYLYHGENSIKLFEYMMAGLPVLGSNFINLERIIMENECGLTVDPTDPARIAEKIMYLANNPEISRKMGENGVKAVMERYNWEKEEEKLLALYHKILNPVVHGGHFHV